MSRRHAGTEEDTGALEAYLREIDSRPRLTVDEERALGLRIREDHQAAVTTLADANLRFVVACAKRCRGLGVPLVDLIHEGSLGLIEAARRFDPSRNVRFLAAASWWVREAMTRVLAEQTDDFFFPPTFRAMFEAGEQPSEQDELDLDPSFDLDGEDHDAVFPIDSRDNEELRFEALRSRLN